METGTEEVEETPEEPAAPTEDLDPAARWKDMTIITSDLNSVIPLDEFLSEFEESGIDLYQMGMLSEINEANYNLVKQLKEIDTTASEAQEVSELDVDESSVFFLTVSIQILTLFVL